MYKINFCFFICILVYYKMMLLCSFFFLTKQIYSIMSVLLNYFNVMELFKAISWAPTFLIVMIAYFFLLKTASVTDLS